MRDQLRGCVRVRARGDRIYAFINELRARKIAVFGQHVKNGVLCCEVYRHDLKKLREIAENSGIDLRSEEAETISAKLLRRRHRVGLILGLILVLGTALYLSGIVVTVEIQGNQRVSEDVIRAALNEMGVSEGTPFGQINYVWCENQLRLTVKDIAWAGMHRTGHRLVVEVTETVEKPEMLNDRLPCNIVAAHEADIVYTSVLDGQLMHIVGDHVFKGDMLINGILLNAAGHIELHHAIGDIQGIYEDEAIFEGQFTKERLVPTGRTDKRRTLRLFNWKIPLYFGRNRYDLREESFEKAPLNAGGKSLPIAVETRRFTELERVETTLTKEELLSELRERIYLYEKNFLSGVEIIERSIEERETDSGIVLTVRYKLKGNIGEMREILAK